jgi:hypothetical protein
MSDWKADIERKLQHKEELLVQQQAKEKEEKRKIQKRRQEQEEREYARKLAAFQGRFKCHVCDKPSTSPGQKVIGHHFEISYGYEERDRKVEDYDYDWNKPENLWHCSVCNKWTCDDCMHRGICRKCYEKGHLPK